MTERPPKCWFHNSIDPDHVFGIKSRVCNFCGAFFAKWDQYVLGEQSRGITFQCEKCAGEAPNDL